MMSAQWRSRRTAPLFICPHCGTTVEAVTEDGEVAPANPGDDLFCCKCQQWFKVLPSPGGDA